MGTQKRFTLWVFLAVFLSSCGGGGAVTEPTEPVPPPAPPAAPAELPPQIFGSFVQSSDVPDAAANGGNVVLVVPTFSDDPQIVASALRANGKVAILSAHFVFGGPEALWADRWAKMKAWAAPLPVAAVYVVDEPMHAGIPADRVLRAIDIVKADGFKTMIAEGVDRALIHRYRPPVDYFGVTCYDFPGPGGWSLDRCEVAYATHPEWNIAIGQGYDWHRRSGSVTSQMERWAAVGRARQGVIYWVWSWPRQEGIRDNAEALATYHKLAGW